MNIDPNDNVPAPYDYKDQLIYLDESETILPFKPDSDINIALKLSVSLSDPLSHEIPFAYEMASCPKFHKLMERLIKGELNIREFGGLCYMAGRLSLALPGRE